MSIFRPAALLSFCVMLVIPVTLLGANEYYWPVNYDVVEFKVKSHAIRGTLKLSLGPKVTIDDKEYQQLMVDTDPKGLPGQNREVYLRADEQGVYSRYSTSSEDKEILDLALPVEVGKTWQTYDRHGNPSQRKIIDISDCHVQASRYSDAIEFESCVAVSYETPGGAAIAIFVPEYGEVSNMRANGFDRRTIARK